MLGVEWRLDSNQTLGMCGRWIPVRKRDHRAAFGAGKSQISWEFRDYFEPSRHFRTPDIPGRLNFSLAGLTVAGLTEFEPATHLTPNKWR